MRPLRLEMKGFAAFREHVVVDFTDVDLLALVGPTGAGKSTIIDAITFALFGSVVRYDDRSAVEPAINQLSTEARVSLSFEVGGLGYTAVRVVRRTAKGASTKEARLEHGDITLAGRASEMGQAVEAVLGLDLDRFTRTVVLPQGRFATFLHDRGADRQELLRHLLDLGAYQRMGTAARESARTASDQLAVLEPRLDGEVPSEAEVAASAEFAAEAVVAAALVESSLTELARARAQESAARSTSEDMGVLALATALIVTPEGVAALSDAHGGAVEETAGLSAELVDARRELNEASRAASAAPSVQSCRSILEALRDLADVEDQLDAEAAGLAGFRRAAVTAAETADDVRATRDRLASETAQARRQLEDRRADLDALDGVAAIDAMRAAHADHAAAVSDVAHAEAAIEPLQSAAERTAARHREHRPDLLDARAGLDQAKALGGIAGLVEHLEPGQHCPLCRQRVDVVPEHDLDADLEAARAAASEAEALEVTLAEDARVTMAAVDSATASIEAMRRTVERLAAGVAKLPSFEEIAVLEARVKTAAEAHEAARQGVRSAVEAEEAAAAAGAVALEAEAEAQRRVAGAESRHETVAARLNELAARVAGSPPPAQLEADIETAEILTRRVAICASAVETLDRRSLAAAARERDLASRLDLAANELRSTRDPMVVLGAPQLSGRLDHDWHTLAEWARRRSAELDELHRRSAAEADLAQAEARDAAAAAAAAAERFIESNIAVDELGRAMSAAVALAQAGAARAAAERVEAAGLEAEIERLRTDAVVDTALAQHLKADGFERWIMAEAIDDLVVRATTKLLELSAGRYSMVADGADFAIRDHHSGDEIRGARTLSGGETFLASLALALGLAESLAELAPGGAEGLGSLFLDEGFGTLDSESLDVVAAAIEELGASGRMVGVVTHIRELAERMPVRYEVAKGPTTSTVTRVDS